LLYQLSGREIKERIKNREAKIAVIGLGRVGLPLASTLADQGFKVIGIDINKKVVSLTNKGISFLKDEVGLQDILERNVKNGRLRASSKIDSVDDSDLVVITVPTLLTRKKEAEISAVIKAANDIAKFSRYKVISLESTVPPFTTQRLGQMIEKRTGLRAGRDFGLAYSPERIQVPQVLKDLKTYPKIVSGIDKKSTLILSEIYSTFAPLIIKMSSPLAAEIEKIIENAYRDVNIAFANELAKLCEIYGVDVFEIIRAANSQPFSNIHSPGCGVGGHCIPMDPYYIIRDAERRGGEPLLLKTARKINESMPKHVVNMVKSHVKAGRVAVLGLSFKPNVKAFEHSHTLQIIKLLKDYEVVAHDPFLEREKFPFKTEKNIYKAVKGSDCVILCTAHSAYKNLKFKKIKKLMKGDLIVDGRGFFNPNEIKKAGLLYKGIGRSHG